MFRCVLFLFKFLFAFGLVLSDSPQGMDSDGWYTLPHPKKEVQAPGADERDMSVWVVFSKKIGSEKILISMPKEPIYRYMGSEGTEMEVISSYGDSEHRLQVINKVYENSDILLESRKQGCAGALIVSENRVDGAYSELVYWQNGKWIYERVIVTSERTYFLQTKSQDVANEAHLRFVNSFTIENQQ